MAAAPWHFGADGSRFLEAYNNVPQVGHAHPHVSRAVARQAAVLNINTRYLYRIVLDYAERLLATMADGLEACLFLNSGSEANDAAFRMAKLVTGNEGALVMENAYHGMTESMDALTPYSHPCRPLQTHVRTLLAPDPYRGPYKKGAPDLASNYAADADRAIADLAKVGLKPAAFMIASGFTSNGIPDVPAAYLARAVAKVRAAGVRGMAGPARAGPRREVRGPPGLRAESSWRLFDYLVAMSKEEASAYVTERLQSLNPYALQITAIATSRLEADLDPDLEGNEAMRPAGLFAP